MHVSVWGPRAWAVLHTFSDAWKENPTVEDRRAMYAFLTSFGPALPCPKCGAHFQACVRRDVPSPNAPVLTSRETLVQWLVGVHNEVNRRLGKREYRGETSVFSASILVLITIIMAITITAVLWVVLRKRYRVQ